MIVWSEVVIRLFCAVFFGAVIGLERERKNWAAGLRTHMMVCLGAALTMMVSTYGFTDVQGGKSISLDPSRIAAQVISGIGFIGAGTILFLRQGIVRGLTTASGLWTVAAIGLATGGGMYFAAFIATVFAIIILWVLQPVEKRFSDRFIQKNIRITVADKQASAKVIELIFKDSPVDVSVFSTEQTEEGFVLSFKFKKTDKSLLAGMISNLQASGNVKDITWSN